MTDSHHKWNETIFYWLVLMLSNEIVWFSNVERLTCVHRNTRFHIQGRMTVRRFNSLLLHERLQRNEKLHQENKSQRDQKKNQQALALFSKKKNVLRILNLRWPNWKTFFKFTVTLKGYLCYKTIFCNKTTFNV